MNNLTNELFMNNLTNELTVQLLKDRSIHTTEATNHFIENIPPYTN